VSRPQGRHIFSFRGPDVKRAVDPPVITASKTGLSGGGYCWKKGMRVATGFKAGGRRQLNTQRIDHIYFKTPHEVNPDLDPALWRPDRQFEPYADPAARGEAARGLIILARKANVAVSFEDPL